MRTFLGLVMAVLGVLLVVHGLDAFDDISSRFSSLVSGSSPDRTGWMLIAGITAVLVGVTVSGHRTRHHPKT